MTLLCRLFATPAEQHHTPHLDVEGCCDCLCPACSVEEGPTHVRRRDRSAA